MKQAEAMRIVASMSNEQRDAVQTLIVGYYDQWDNFEEERENYWSLAKLFMPVPENIIELTSINWNVGIPSKIKLPPELDGLSVIEGDLCDE